MFIGPDDDLIGVPDDVQVGLTNASSDFNFADLADSPAFTTPASYTAAITGANNFYNEGNTLATVIAGLPPTDYADTALDNARSTADQWIIPDQITLIGELAYMLS